MWRVCLALACLSLCASCGVLNQPRQVPVPVYQCFMRPEFLQATPVPDYQDETLGDLLEENRLLREALTACNQDKAKASTLIKNQQPKNPPAGGTP